MYEAILYMQEMMMRMHVVDRQQELLESSPLGRWTAKFGGGIPATGMPMLTSTGLLLTLAFRHIQNAHTQPLPPPSPSPHPSCHGLLPLHAPPTPPPPPNPPTRAPPYLIPPICFLIIAPALSISLFVLLLPLGPTPQRLNRRHCLK